MGCPNYYPVVSLTESNSINPCFIAVLLYAISGVSFIVALVQCSKPRHKVGSIHVQAASYKFRRLAFVVYISFLLAYLSYVDSPFFLYLVLTNLVINLVVLRVLVQEVLYSIIPSGVVLYSSLLEFIIFSVLSLQSFFDVETPAEKSVVTTVIQLVLTISALAIFVSECVYYNPSVELINYYLTTGMPIHIPHAITRFTYSHLNAMVERNFGNPNMRVKDLQELEPEFLSDHSFDMINAAWMFQMKYKKSSLLLALLQSVGYALVASFLYQLLAILFTYVQPQLFRILIESIADEEKTFVLKFLICIAMLLCSAANCLTSNVGHYLNSTIALELNVGLKRLLYNKAMRLSPEAKKVKSTGDILSMIAVDTSIIQNVLAYGLAELLFLPSEIFVALGSLYFLLGNTVWIGLLIMIIAIPINTKIMQSISFLQNRHLTRRDARTSLITDILSSIKSIKLYAWEKPMMEQLDRVRNQEELGDLVRLQYYESLANLVSNIVPYVICGTSFYFYGKLSDVPLTAAVLFPALALFDMLSTPISYLPEIFSGILELLSAIKRVQEFLLMEEIEEKSHETGNIVGVEILNAKFLWSKKDYKVALENINYSVSNGKLSCIVGRVGAGKTAFLKLILGELPMVSNDLVKPAVYEVNGSIAYCPQTPWIMNASLKQNILFNYEYDEHFYNLVLECCDLTKDIATFANGDNTLVGEKGITLSGGQKLRVSLARALYARADIYILDDILSAVDSHVSAKLIAKIFNKNGGLLSQRTTILATNNVKVLNFADEVVFLEDNTILERGSFEEVVSNDSKLAELIKNFGSTVDEQELKSFEPVHDLKIPEPKYESSGGDAILARLTHSEGEDDENSEKLIFGNVGLSVYTAYAKACGASNIILTLIVLVLSASVEFGDSYWLKHWADINQKFEQNVKVGYYIGIFMIIAVVISLLSCLRGFCYHAILPIKAAKKLHHEMAVSVIRLPMQFFDSTPMGRILNRFTSDIDDIDRELSGTFNTLSIAATSLVVIFIVISVNFPVMLILFFFLGFFYRYYHIYYVSLSREIKRMASVTRSPVVSLIGEAIGGDETVRAFNQLSIFDYFVSLLMDNNSRVLYSNFSFARWISVRLQLLGAVVIFSVATLSVLTQKSSHALEAGTIALVLSYTLRITSSLERIVRFSAICESEIVSVERVLEYSDLPSEAPLIIEDHRTPPNWPTNGAIEFVNYSTTYKEGLTPVLKNLNFKINPGEKIGIVGRTGAGKSTLALAIFRLLEPMGGFINIDGINISEIGLFDLRHSLNIIPQDAQALKGTIRSNLDPFSAHSDETLMKALKLSHLDKFLKEENLLDYAVSEGGSNLSVGQRQLLCLSRALLNPSKILILDEATAAVDVETDKIIQETIRKEFNDRTIITIAHRLDTILDYDKVLLLDAGEVKEFGTVDQLLKDKDGLFYKMCDKGGYL